MMAVSRAHAVERYAALVGMGSIGLKEDHLRLQVEDPGEQRLLVVGQGPTALSLSLQILLQQSNSQHEVAFVEAL
jgi:hypothetical protein